jgi:hypothetical protein
VSLQYGSGNCPFVDSGVGQRSLFIAMANQMTHTPVPYRPWAVWLLRLLLIPIAGATGAMVFGLYTVLATGRLGSPGRNFGPASNTIVFDDSPVWFSIFFVLYAVVAAILVVGTLALARLALRRRPEHR